MQLFQGCLARVSGREQNHELRPWSFLPAEGGRLGSESAGRRGAAARCCSRRFCSITVALGVGPRGEAPAPSQTSGPRRPSRRCSAYLHPPLPASRSAEHRRDPRPPAAPRRAKSLEISTAAGTAGPPRASPPIARPRSHPSRRREKELPLSSVNSAAHRSLPQRPGLRRHTPELVEIKVSPRPSPPAKLPPLTRSDPRRSAGERTPSPALVPPEVEANNKIKTINNNPLPQNVYIQILSVCVRRADSLTLRHTAGSPGLSPRPPVTLRLSLTGCGY